MKLRLNTHAQCENIDSCAETKSKKCASDKNSRPANPILGGSHFHMTPGQWLCSLINRLLLIFCYAKLCNSEPVLLLWNVSMAAIVKATPKLALLVIDMQEHFRDIGAAIVPELNSTIKECRAKQIPVIFTQHGHKHVELDSGVLGKFWGYRNMIQYKSQDWKLLPELCIEEKDVVIDESEGTMLSLAPYWKIYFINLELVLW